MRKPVGGRGKVAPYQTTHIRVPVPIKQNIQLIVDDYIQQVVSGQMHPERDAVINNVFWDRKMPSKDEAVQLAKEILKQKKSAKQSIAKLLTVLYGEKITL